MPGGNHLRETPEMSRIVFLFVVLMAGVMPVAHSQDVGFVQDVANRINNERKQKGLKKLKYNATLAKAAQFHAEWMARNQKMEHLQEEAKSLEDHRTCTHHPINRAIKAGYIKWDDVFSLENRPEGQIVHAKEDANEYVGEIIAAGWNAGHPATQTPTVVPGWMNASGHRKEILTAHYQEMGIGTAVKGNNTFWCVVFGRPNK
jgi:uncharacterized protein YkwD